MDNTKKDFELSEERARTLCKYIYEFGLGALSRDLLFHLEDMGGNMAEMYGWAEFYKSLAEANSAKICELSRKE